FPQGDAHIAQTGGRDPHGGDKIQAQQAKDQRPDDENKHIEDKEANDVVHDVLGDRPVVVAYRNDGTGVQAPFELQDPVLDDQQVAHDLDAPGGGSGGTAQEHQPKEQHRQKGGPRGIVRGDKTGGGDHAQHLKKGMADNTFHNPKDPGIVLGHRHLRLKEDAQGRDQEYDEHKPQVIAELLVPEDPLYPAGKSKITEHEIGARQEHEHYGDVLDQGLVVPIGQTGVFGGE